MRWVRVLFAIFMLVLSTIVPLGAQGVPPRPAESAPPAPGDDVPTFTSSTELVQVDVVVKSKGKLMKGLTKDDFELYDNGDLQNISVFSVREPGGPKAERFLLPEGAVTNRPILRGAEPVSATVLLLDAQNTLPKDLIWGRDEALRYLARAPRGELIAVYMLGTTLKVIQDFTDDVELLRGLLEKFRAGMSTNLDDDLLAGVSGNAVAATQAISLQRRIDITQQTFHSLALNLKGLPGRKKVVWISASVPITLTQTVSRNGFDMREFTVYADQIYKAAKVLSAANIALYPVDPRPPTEASFTDPAITTMLELAERTGGKAAYMRGDLEEAFEEAFTDTDVTYTLGFYPASDGRRRDANNRNHSIKVKVRGDGWFRGIDVSYRKTYEAEAPTEQYTARQRRDALDNWVMEPLNVMDIPILAKARPSEGRKDYMDVAVVIDVTALHLEEKNGTYTGSVDLAVVPDAGLKPKGLQQTIALRFNEERYRQALENGITVINQLRAFKEGKPLAKDFHVVVMDGTTLKAGGVRLPIAVP